MPFRVYRRFSIIPGLRVNLSRSGASVSIGHRGGWFTFGPHGRRVTMGLPGSGLSYTQTYPSAKASRIAMVSHEAVPPASPPHAGHRSAFAIVVILLGLIVLAAVTK